MAASVYFWHTLRFDFFHVNPPLTRIVSGLPVVLCGPNCDWDCYSTRPQDRAEWGVGKAFIAANDPWNVRWYFAIALVVDPNPSAGRVYGIPPES